MQDTNDADETNTGTVVVTTVTDNDDDDGNFIDIAAQQQELQQEKLRIAAEKRRQRILQQANTRMSIVEGTYSSSATTGIGSSTTTTTAATTDPVPTTIDENTVEDVTTTTVLNVDGTQADMSNTTTTEEVEAPVTANTASTTSSSKLAAMRRRRFQKKTTATAATTTTAALGSELASTEEITSTVTTSMVEEHRPPSEVAGTKDTIIEVSIDAPTDISNPIVVDPISDTIPMTVPLDEHAAEDVATTTTKISASKKYLGVAKMRRRMNKERQEQQEGQTSTTDHGSSSGGIGSSATRNNSKVQQSLPPKKVRSMILSLPIIMYAITTILLFLSGLQVGLQQSTIQYCYSNSTIQGDTPTTLSEDGYCINNSNINQDDEQWTVAVHSELAPRKMGGLQRILSIMNVLPAPVVNQDEEKTTKILKKPSLAEPVRQDTVSVEDEFAFTTGNSNRIINIDPVLGVDLDALTAGDGIYFGLARFAVRVHRTILLVIYYTPLSIIQSILSIFYSFIQTPPTLFVFAVLIRHGIGKFVLGAKLPETVTDETQHKDILSTVKTFVMKFISSSFPTVTVLYDVWTHIRSDMYVMLCGLFVGLALSHHHQASSPYGEYGTSKVGSSSMTSDEL